MTEEKKLIGDITESPEAEATELEKNEAIIEEEPSRPLSYYRELKEKEAGQEAAINKAGENAEEEISRPLSWYKEQKTAEKTAAAGPTENIEPDEADDDEPSRPLSWYKEQKAAEKTAAGGPTENIEPDEADDDEPSRPLSWYKEQKAAEKASASSAENTEPDGADNTAENEKVQAAEIDKPAEASKRKPIFPVKGKPLGVQGIAEGAVLAALSVILGFISWNIPFLSIVAQLVFPLPMAVLTMRRGLAAGIYGTIVTGILLALIINPISALLLIVQSCIVGIFFGYCRKLEKNSLFTLAGGTVIASLGYAAAIVLSVMISGIGWDYIWQVVDDMMLAYEQVLQGMGFYETLSAQGIDPVLYMEQLTTTMNMLLPGALIISTMLATCASYWIFGKVLVALGYEHKPLPPFAEWRLSWHFVWGIIIGGFLMFLGYANELQILYNIGTNILYVFAPLLLTTAIAVIVGIKRARGWTGMATLLIIFCIFAMLPISLYALILIGVFDPLFDFRAKFAVSKE